jgi:hypothetical protein
MCVCFCVVECPNNLTYLNVGQFVQARVSRARRRQHKPEDAATEIGEALLFLEHDLFSQVTAKLSVLGFNAIFYLRIQVVYDREFVCAHSYNYRLVAFQDSSCC